MKKITLLFLVVLVSACNGAKVDYSYPNDPEDVRKQRAGKFFEGKEMFAGKKDDANKADVAPAVIPAKSTALWTASVEVISSLLPLATADEKSGLIITEWYMDGEKQNDRIKINLLVKGAEIKDENLILTIFRQAKSADGTWIDEQSSDRNLSSKMIKDKIIQKAKTK